MRRFPILLGLLVLAISGASIDANEGRRSGTPIHGVQFTQKGYIQVRINVLNAFDRLMCLLLPAPSPPPLSPFEGTYRGREISRVWPTAGLRCARIPLRNSSSAGRTAAGEKRL